MKKIVSVFLILVTVSSLSYAKSFNIQNFKTFMNQQIYDQGLEGENCLVFQVDLEVDHLEGVEGDYNNLYAELYHKVNGVWEPVPYASKGSLIYATASNGDCVRAIGEERLRTNRHSIDYGFRLFLPQRAIQHPQGKVEYRLDFYVLQEPEYCCVSEFVMSKNGGYYISKYVNITWNSPNDKAKDHSQIPELKDYPWDKTSTDYSSNSSYNSGNGGSNYQTSYQPTEEREPNISATYGFNGEWSFVFYSNGTFKSRVWYGKHGEYDTQYMKDIRDLGVGTYYIIRRQLDASYAQHIVHLRFSNGREATGRLKYVKGASGSSFEYDHKSHFQLY